MSVPFKDLKVGKRYSFTDLGTRRVDTGVLLRKYVSAGDLGEEHLIISVERSVDRPSEQRSAPYSLYTIESLEPEPREAIRDPIREREKERGEERKIEQRGIGRKRKTHKGKKSRKTLKKTQSRRRRRGGSSCSGI
jgi:hypothetical protein